MTNKTYVEFTEWLDSQNDLNLIIKTHIFVEDLMNRYFKLKHTKPKVVAKMNFHSKVVVLYAMNHSENLFKCLILLNKIRNEYAHNYRYNFYSDNKKVRECNTVLSNQTKQNDNLVERFCLYTTGLTAGTLDL